MLGYGTGYGALIVFKMIQCYAGWDELGWQEGWLGLRVVGCRSIGLGKEQGKWLLSRMLLMF